MDKHAAMKRFIRFVCLSDTHSQPLSPSIPPGDVLLFAGDFSNRGSPASISAFNSLLQSLPHTHKIVIAGNHDHSLDPTCWSSVKSISPYQYENTEPKKVTAGVYLENQGCEVFGYRIWGTPWIRSIRPGAFTVSTENELEPHYSQIPDSVDILLTHCPAHSILDTNSEGKSQGSTALLRLLHRLRPRVHVFGHIHESYGQYHPPDSWLSLNASTCSVKYEARNPPLVFDLP